MSAVKTFRRAFTVAGHRATVSVQLVAGSPIGITVDWDRDHPPRLAGRDRDRYRRLRNAVLQGLANEMGARIAIADAESNGTWTVDTIQPETQPGGAANAEPDDPDEIADYAPQWRGRA